MRASRAAGFSLLEVLVALALLGSVGGAAVALLAQTRSTLASTLRREEQVRSAGATLARFAQEPRRRLLAHVGQRYDGAHLIRVSLVSDALISVDVMDPERRDLLVSTLLYRPGEGPDAR